MKNKITYLILIAFSTLLSCSNDDGNNQEETPLSLCGTEWNYISPVVDGYQQDLLLYFLNDNDVKLILDGFRNGNLVNEEAYEGTYSYNSSNLEITLNTVCNGGSIFSNCILTGKVNGRKLRVENDGDSFEYSRVGNTVDGDCLESSDSIQLREYRIRFSGSSTPNQQYPLTATFYKSNLNGNLESETIMTTTNTDIFVVNTLATFDKIGFKYQTESASQTVINRVEIYDGSNNVVFDDNNLSINIGQTFIYTFSTATHSID